MEGDAIPERERLQIELIMELDSEELEVEEVDDEDSSGDDYQHDAVGASTSGGYTYDTSLVALHSYLGDVEDTRNRVAFLDGGAVVTLPLFYLEGVVLFPEATLPLRVISPNFIAGVERAMRQVHAPYMIGVVRVHRDANDGRMFSTTGTTAEIRQYRRLEDGSVNIVARGQQRFHLKRHWIDAEGSLCGKVHIIQEDIPLRTPREAVGKLAPLRNSLASNILKATPLNDSLRSPHNCEEGNDSDAMSEGSFESELSSTERRLHQHALVSSHSSDVCNESVSSDHEKFERHSKIQAERSRLDSYTRSMNLEYNKQSANDSPRAGKSPLSEVQLFNKAGWGKYSLGLLRDVPRAYWSSWVYRMYDSYSLARKVADRWKQIVKAPSMDSFVMKPDLLSFQIASKIPISESARQELLEIDGTSYRLRREIELLESFDKIKIHCKTCETSIAKKSDMLVMSNDGPCGAFANPHGFVHEVMTLTRTNGIVVTGHPEKEYSWFPGYAWSIAECIICGRQLGWYFSATKKSMRPQAFWGIRSSQVVDESL